MFVIDMDEASRRVTIRISGFFTVAEAADYIDTIRSKFVRLMGHGRYVMQIDIRDCPLQSQEVVDAFVRHIAGFPKADRIAIICGRSPAKMQMRRILPRDYARFVDTPVEARAWLFGDGTMQTAA